MADFAANHLISFGSSVVVTYTKRGRDSNGADPPPFGGPIVDDTIIGSE